MSMLIKFVSRFITMAVVVGIVLGATGAFAFFSSDLMHYNTSTATAHAMEQQTQSKAAKDALDLGFYKTQKDQETEKAAVDLENYKTTQRLEMENQQRQMEQQLEMQRQKAAQELAAQQAKADQDLMLARLTQYAVLAIIAAATMVVSIGALFFLIQKGRSQMQLAQAEAERQRELAQRAEMIRQARENERTERRAMLQRAASHKISSITQAKNWKDHKLASDPIPQAGH
ncbi:MAG: hypothetical protein WCF84_11110 [Anaerolineae bacterium]